MNGRMKTLVLAGAGMLALTSTLVLAQDAPESLLPDAYRQATPTPAPKPSPTPAPRPATPAPRPSANPAPTTTSSPVIQQLPGSGSGQATTPAPQASENGGLTLRDLERLDPDELDVLLGLRPKSDIPPAARRSMEEVGIIGPGEGGVPTGSLGRQPAALVRAALTGTKGPLVSRWGHILLRRVLASRLSAPADMDPAEFVALRAGLLNRIGEYPAARALVQNVDTVDWNPALADAAITAYLATGDILGTCPLARFSRDMRDDVQWRMLRDICAAYSGEAARARANLKRIRRGDAVENIDVLLAQRFAGAAGQSRGAVNLEWDGVEELTPWRFALASALGAEIPDRLTDDENSYFQYASAISPALSATARMPGMMRGTGAGIFSANALIDLYSQYYAENGTEGDLGARAVQLRNAYVAADPAARVAAIDRLWGTGEMDYASRVLTAYAAARIPPSEALSDRAGPLIGSMLTAGLDRDALEWGNVVPEGSLGWALLALVQFDRDNSVGSGAVRSFVEDDDSGGQRRSQFLVAGLAGLGRIDEGTRDDLSDTLNMSLGGATHWARLIDSAAAADNQALVALLAGVGMQGTGWDKMTPRHLYHIVAALDRVGLRAEARMIAAEAVYRG
ncbi:hypothetical protein [Erythrobacter sp. LQ02-29]|uniref:hypothetical protein n=1 Tax=Erythrobacter sp. LQ02-29 TaxID=2920384 RepID=UPI00277D070E|nr:hypothetical protein [Erythrobacter sp. LQ02-29]